MCTEQLVTYVSKVGIDPLSDRKILVPCWSGWSRTELKEMAEIEAATDAVMEYAKQTGTKAGCEGILWVNVATRLEELMGKMPMERAIEQCKKEYDVVWWLG